MCDRFLLFPTIGCKDETYTPQLRAAASTRELFLRYNEVISSVVEPFFAGIGSPMAMATDIGIADDEDVG